MLSSPYQFNIHSTSPQCLSSIPFFTHKNPTNLITPPPEKAANRQIMGSTSSKLSILLSDNPFHHYRDFFDTPCARTTLDVLRFPCLIFVLASSLRLKFSSGIEVADLTFASCWVGYLGIVGFVSERCYVGEEYDG